MSVPIAAITSGTTTAAIAASAAAARRRKQEEEEKLTQYQQNDLDGWEFKIIRANTRIFKKPATIRRVCAEEALAGWEMVEKFDDNRIRFKRRIDKRVGDQFLDGDPYRTQIGASEGQIAALVIGVLVLVAGMAVAVFMQVR